MREVEFIVRDNEDNPLENAKVTVKTTIDGNGQTLATDQTTNAEGKFKMTNKVNLGKCIL